MAIAVVAFFLERSAAHRPRADADARAGRGPVEIAAGAVGVVLGALLFGGALADGGYETLIGILLGPTTRRWVVPGRRPRRAGGVRAV